METLSAEREHLVTDNLNLVHYTLHKYFHINPGHNEYEDLFQEGCIGLIKAAIRFDESRGFQFSTYASHMISGQIRRYKRDKSNLVRIPRDRYNLLMKVIQMTTEGMSVSDIEEMTGYSARAIQKCLQFKTMATLDKNISEDSAKDTPMYEVIEDSRNDLEETLSIDNITESINKVLESLNQEMYKNIWEEYIWALYYGEKLNQQYFANKYGISQAQVSRILRKCKELFVKTLAGV